MLESNATLTTCQVDFELIGRRITVAPDTTLLEAIQHAGLAIASACGGVGRCGQCRLILLNGKVSPLTPDEQTILTESDIQHRQHLACQVRVQGHIKVLMPELSLLTTQRLQLTSDIEELTLDPVVHAYDIEIPPPTLQDPRSDVERLTAALPLETASQIIADMAVVRQITRVARTSDWRLTTLLRDTEIVGVLPSGSSPVGIAIDLGTTKIAASLLDLVTGEELAVAGALNPQIRYGEDIISRLAYVTRTPDGGHALAVMVRDTLNHLTHELVQQADVSSGQIAEVCLVGNTAMTHLLLEFPVRQLAMSPYVAATTTALDIKARDVGLTTAPGAYIHVLPCIGGFVGADHVAMILATHLDHPDTVAVGIDIGTNTEIVLSKPEGMLTAAACASGPAFEGAHISDGMRAAAGAIESVVLTENGIRLSTVDTAPAIGLCGSGIIDCVAELRGWNIINTRGRFERQHHRVHEGQHGPEFLLVSADQSDNQRNVIITQQDINQIQLAKGAIRAGLEILLETANIIPEEVNEVIIAGAFGSFLNVQNALNMGLFPRLSNAHYRQVGNAALAGAKRGLVSHQARERARQIAARTHYLELTTFPQFNRRFALGMLFP